MLQIRGQTNMERYQQLIDEQVVVGWDSLPREKFSKQWKLQQKAYINRRKLRRPRLYARVQRNKKRKAATDKTNSKRKDQTERFHSFLQAIITIIQEIWMNRCIGRNKPVLRGRIVAEYDYLMKKVTHLCTH